MLETASWREGEKRGEETFIACQGAPFSSNGFHAKINRNKKQTSQHSLKNFINYWHSCDGC